MDGILSSVGQLDGEGSKQNAASPEKRLGRRSLIKYALAAGGVVLLGGASYEYYQSYVAVPKHCEACGMAIMPEMEQHLLIRDELTSQRVYACCQGCALKLADPVRGRKEYTIQTFCDYFGPERKIMINVKDHGNSVSVDPVTARLLLGAKVVKSCANNRFAYNQEAVDGLLKQGYTQYTMAWQQHPLPEGTPVLEIPKATPVLANGGITYVAPSPIMPMVIAVAGALTLGGSLLAYRKLTRNQ